MLILSNALQVIKVAYFCGVLFIIDEFLSHIT